MSQINISTQTTPTPMKLPLIDCRDPYLRKKGQIFKPCSNCLNHHLIFCWKRFWSFSLRTENRAEEISVFASRTPALIVIIKKKCCFARATQTARKEGKKTHIWIWGERTCYFCFTVHWDNFRGERALYKINWVEFSSRSLPWPSHHLHHHAFIPSVHPSAKSATDKQRTQTQMSMRCEGTHEFYRASAEDRG